MEWYSELKKLDMKSCKAIKVKVKSLSRVLLSVTPWTVACQAPLSMGFSRQEYWSGLPFPSPGDLPDPGIKPGSPSLQADALTSELPGKPKKDPLKALSVSERESESGSRSVMSDSF